jgi:hypothetical protein
MGLHSPDKRGTLGAFRRQGMAIDFKHDVFLSHNKANKPRVRRLAAE